MSFIPAHGGYNQLIAYQKSQIVYDATVYFTRKYLSIKDRTIDQMIQAARSGKQNIAEGSRASGISKETEIKLIQVARASLEELLVDYKDFMRTRKLNLWDKNHPYYKRLAELNKISPPTYELFKKGIESDNLEICVNVIIGLINVTCYLLDSLMRRLEKDFVTLGSVRERMTRARIAEKKRQKIEEKNDEKKKGIAGI